MNDSWWWVTAMRPNGGWAHPAAWRGWAMHGGSVGKGRPSRRVVGEAACGGANRPPPRAHRAAFRGGAPGFASACRAGGLAF